MILLQDNYMQIATSKAFFKVACQLLQVTLGSFSSDQRRERQRLRLKLRI